MLSQKPDELLTSLIANIFLVANPIQPQFEASSKILNYQFLP